jgi:metallo-beta-lactamase class B
MFRFPIAAVVFAAATSQAETPLVADPPKDCTDCASWNVPQKPFRIFGNTYYVGTTELSAILVAGDDGHILLDAALPQSTPLIDASIQALGFRTADVRLIVNSHTHYDHAGGIAAFQRVGAATVAASQRAAEALRAGKPNADDPQFAIAGNEFPPVRDVRVVGNGGALAVGEVRITAHFTPGHTPGGTTWAWRSCEGARCLDIVYADSLNAVSADGFRFSGSASTPSIVERFEQSIRIVEELPCDILLSPHPGLFGMQDRLRRRSTGEADAFVDSGSCRAYAGAARGRLERRIELENAAASPP